MAKIRTGIVAPDKVIEGDASDTKCPRTGTVGLVDGLLVAQGAIDGVAKDAKNTFHRYSYTSAEGMISACRAALQIGGVVARRTAWRVTDDGLYVVSTVSVAHAWTLEEAIAEIVWPVVVEKGRPIDKAVASALTTSLGYWLRDVLLLPREDGDGSMDQRNDASGTAEHGIRRAPTAATTPATASPRATAQTPVQAINARMAATVPPAAPVAPAAAWERTNPVTEPQPPALCHRISERIANGQTFHIGEFIADGSTSEYVLDGVLYADICDQSRDVLGVTFVPVIIKRGGSRMPLLVELRDVAQPTPTPTPTTKKRAIAHADELPF
jgi:hypothetical protein